MNAFDKYFVLFNHDTLQPLNTGMKLVDQLGKVLPAIKVFSASIWFLAKDMFSDLEKRFQDIRLGDIRWVITVPAIWTDQAKYLMREYALQVKRSS